MTYLIWLSVFSVICAASLLYFTGGKSDGLVISAVFLLIALSLDGLAIGLAHMGATSDVEIWNGQITSKSRETGSYVRTYECNCTETCSGTGSNRTCSKSCQTCTEDHYTLTHSCESTIGAFTIQHLDWTSRRVYDQPNPARWEIINRGDPVSKQHSYTNYVQAVPESLFRPASETVKAKFAGLVPAYPDNVYDFYRNDHFLSPGYAVNDARQWNDDLAELLKVRGSTKQVNAIVVVAKTADPDYIYALRDTWEGANKNDVVLVIGSATWPKIDFVDVLSWTKNELFKVQLRDTVMAVGQVQREPILAALAKQIDTNFERRHMKEFEYLSDEIAPPAWLVVLVVVLNIGGVAGLLYYGKRRPAYRRF